MKGFINRKPFLALAGQGNPLIDPSEVEKFMLSHAGRILWKSGVDLVSANLLRGYCIANSLTPENLFISSLHGTFGLRRILVNDISNLPAGFAGFKALRELFAMTAQRSYGASAMHSLLPDVVDWLETLDWKYAHTEKMATCHPCLLLNEQRGWFSVRLAQLLTSELRYKVKCHRSYCEHVFQNLEYLNAGLDEMHPFFREWRTHSNTVRENMAQEQEQGGNDYLLDLLPDDLEAELARKRRFRNGRWVVMMNRHGVLHPHNSRLCKLAGATYSVNDVIELLHFKLPMYLPKVVSLFRDLSIWRHLGMDGCFQRSAIYPWLPFEG